MTTAAAVCREIQDLTSLMIEVGLSLDQNFPSTRTSAGRDGAVTDVTITNVDEISAAMKDRPYSEIYESLRQARAYNMLLVDGAIIQFRYRFSEKGLLKHVLAFYPSPDLLEYQNAPEIYETDVLYADVINKNVVTTPLRFDFDEQAFEENVHPKSHFTIGQYQGCRIPVSHGLTPFRFMKFILGAFYNTPFRAYCSDWKAHAEDFPLSVTKSEASNLHMAFA